MQPGEATLLQTSKTTHHPRHDGHHAVVPVPLGSPVVGDGVVVRLEGGAVLEEFDFPVGEDRKSVVVGKECRSRWSPYH